MATNDLPGALWPVVWVPMQQGGLGGSLVVVVVIHADPRKRWRWRALVGSQAAWGARRR